MSGWPAVITLTATGHATRLRHMQSSMFGAWHYTSPPPAVTLQPGDSAYAIVAADDEPAGGNTRCPAPYVRLRVSPPGDSGTVTISAWLPGAVSCLPACASADGAPTARDVDDNNAFQPSALTRISASSDSVTPTPGGVAGQSAARPDRFRYPSTGSRAIGVPASVLSGKLSAARRSACRRRPPAAMHLHVKGPEPYRDPPARCNVPRRPAVIC